MPLYVKYSGLRGPSLIAGNLGGKQVNCAIRQVQGGHLAPGTYHISAPIKDPIYGTTAHLTSAAQLSSVEVRGWDPDKRKEVVGAAAKFHMPSAFVIKGTFRGAQSDVVTEKVGADHISSGQVFVLCDKPVLGRNTLVVSMGFADLMDALQSSGGATVTIS